MTGTEQWEFGRYSFTLVPVTDKAKGWSVTNDEFSYDLDTVGATIVEGLERTPEILSYLYLSHQHNCNVTVVDSTKSQNVDKDALLLKQSDGYREWVGEQIKQRMDDHEIQNHLDLNPTADIDAFAEQALDRNGLNGTPDLLIYDIWSKSAGKDPLYQFIEVKGPRDRVGEEQKKWYRIFNDIFPVYLMWYELVEKYDISEKYGVEL